MQKIEGASWPHKIKNNNLLVENSSLEKFYYGYKNLSIKKLGKICTLKPHLLSEYLFRIATCEEILKEVKNVIGENVNIWSSAFFVKEPKSKKFVGFHQDSPYWQLSSNNVVTAWISFTESNANNGCVQFIENIVQESKIFPLDINDSYTNYKKGNKTTSDKDMISYKQDIPKKNLAMKKHYVELHSGEFSIHDITVIHGSNPNKSNKARIGFAVRYIDSDTYHLRDKDDRALNISGIRSKYLKQDNPPNGEFTQANIDSYKLSIESAGGFGNKSY